MPDSDDTGRVEIQVEVKAPGLNVDQLLSIDAEDYHDDVVLHVLTPVEDLAGDYTGRYDVEKFWQRYAARTAGTSSAEVTDIVSNETFEVHLANMSASRHAVEAHWSVCRVLRRASGKIAEEWVISSSLATAAAAARFWRP